MHCAETSIVILCVCVVHREELEEECARRRADIAFLQQCLDGEAGFRDESLAATSTPKPSLQGRLLSKNECLSFRHCICAYSLRPTFAWFETGAAYPQHCQASSSGNKDSSGSRQQTPPTSCPRPSHSSYEQQRVSPCLLSSSTAATHTYIPYVHVQCM